ncbi:hypothetical protein LCGC14_1281710 [marine sediment metagenome]|uniref:Uncharacterized protein n=1 Tax=marine sediment metagenome TaxID=412755 RepID=A0A0F9KWM7_9ZZZZ
MALERAVNYGKEFRFVIGLEVNDENVNTYGTKPEGPLCELYCEPVNVDRGITVVKVKGSHGSMDPIDAERKNTVRGAVSSYTLEMPLMAVAGASPAKSPLWVLCACLFQNQSSNVFSFFDTAPSGDGVTHSFFFGIVSPVAGESLTFSGSVVKSLDFTWTMDEPATVSAECESKNAGLVGQTLDGGVGGFLPSGSANDTVSLDSFTFTENVNGAGDTAISVDSASIHFAWDEVKKVTSDGHGNYSDKIFIGREGCTFTYTKIHATQAELAMAASEAGQDIVFTISAGPPYAAGAYFKDIWVRGKVDGTPEQVYDGVYKQTVTCTMLAASNSTNIAEIDLNITV